MTYNHFPADRWQPQKAVCQINFNARGHAKYSHAKQVKFILLSRRALWFY